MPGSRTWMSSLIGCSWGALLSCSAMDGSRPWHVTDKHSTTWLHCPPIKQEVNLPFYIFVLCSASVGWMGRAQLARVIFAHSSDSNAFLFQNHTSIDTLRNIPAGLLDDASFFGALLVPVSFFPEYRTVLWYLQCSCKKFPVKKSIMLLNFQYFYWRKRILPSLCQRVMTGCQF